MRPTIIAGNWKMNMDKAAIKTFFETLNAKQLVDHTIICVPSIYLCYAQAENKNPRVSIGVQNVASEVQGAFTGEVSALMLADNNVEYVIIGHSERREYYGETDSIINRKMQRALEQNIKPILCVGEILAERKANATKQVVTTQIKNCLKDISEEDITKVIIAYEPVWAIGSGESASNEDANQVCEIIRLLVAELYTPEIAAEMIIQYGGSVTPDNFSSYLEMPNIDGALVGGASIDIEKFCKLIK